jgi:hypothetical protein
VTLTKPVRAASRQTNSRISPAPPCPSERRSTAAPETCNGGLGHLCGPDPADVAYIFPF